MIIHKAIIINSKLKSTIDQLTSIAHKLHKTKILIYNSIHEHDKEMTIYIDHTGLAL